MTSAEKQRLAEQHLNGDHDRRYVDACDMCWAENNRPRFGVIPTPPEDE